MGLCAVVAGSGKQRFKLREEHTKIMIRANQGHSIPGIEPDLTLVDSSAIPFAVHGTYYKAWETIKNEGIHQMERNHIHLARDLPGSSGVISGMRSSCEILIWVDLRKAEASGVTFYESANGVILTEGINGVLCPAFFDR